MGYLKRLGIGLIETSDTKSKIELSRADLDESELEKRLANLLVSRDGPKEYNRDLRLMTYLHFLKVFSKDRSRDPYDSGYTQNLMDWTRQISGWDEVYKIDKMLTILLSPVQDIEAIRERQSLLKRYISSQSKEEDVDTAELTRAMIRDHYSLYTKLPEDLDKINMKTIANPFINTVESLVRFRDRFALDPQLGCFAERIDAILTRNTITELAVLLEQGGVVIMGTGRRAAIADRDAKIGKKLEKERRERQGTWMYSHQSENEPKQEGYEFWLARSGPIGKGIFDLGLFKPGDGAKMKDYPNQKNHVAQMINFVHDSSVLVYTLAAMQYQAEIYNRRKNLGLPVCIPEVNDEGRFRVKNGHPIATRLEEEPVPLNLGFDKSHRKFIVAGAHSGGKTELLTNIGLYILNGVGGGIWPAEEGDVPLTREIITSMRKRTEQSKGSLESELKSAMEIALSTGERDVILIDEFLDTTKPELAGHISHPVLFGEEKLCRGFANTPGTFFIVDHRAPTLEENRGFEFMYPVLKKVRADELARALSKRPMRYGEDSAELDYLRSLKRRTLLVPTHRFVVGKPDPKEVKKHALQMWQRIMWDIDHRDKRSALPVIVDHELYSLDELDDSFRRRTEEKARMGQYVTWQVPGKIGGVWVNDPTQISTPEDEESDYGEPDDDTIETTWAGDEVVIEEDEKELEQPVEDFRLKREPNSEDDLFDDDIPF